MSIEEFFKELDILEQWYDKNYLTLDMYFQIKSRIIDVNKEKLIQKDSEDSEELPF